MNQPTVREINAHVFAGTGVCMVYGKGWRMRISYARTRQGITEGHVINLNTDDGVHMPQRNWQIIPPDATVELL